MAASLEERVQQFIGSWVSDEQAMRLLDEGRAEAEAEVKAIVKAAIKAALLRRVASSMQPSHTEAAEKRASAAADQQAAVADQTVAAAVALTAIQADATTISDATTSPGSRDAADAWYVYGVTWAEDDVALDGVQGVDPQSRLTSISQGALAALASRVRPDAFTGVALQQRASDLGWIAAKVRAHNAVLAATCCALVPFRFGAVFKSEAAIRQMLSERQQELTKTLAAVDGKTEWAAKVFRHQHHGEALTTDSPNGRSEESPDLAHAPPAAGDGRAYLLKKRQACDARRTVRKRALLAAETSCHRLAALADRTIQLSLQKGADIARQDEMLLHVGYLLPRTQQRSFQKLANDLAEQLQSQGLLLEISGPWPPYHFVDAETIRDAAV